MPRAVPRQRIVYCDCLDCADKQELPSRLPDAELDIAAAVAQQLPPPKAILLVGSGLLQCWDGVTTLETCKLPHLGKAVKEGCLGVAAVRTSTTGGPSPPMVAELQQLLGVYQDDTASDQTAPATLSSQFKGLQAVGASSSAAARQLLQAVGASLPESLQLNVHGDTGTTGDATGSSASQTQAPAGLWPGEGYGLPQPKQYASQLLEALGPADGTQGPDVVLVHVDALDLVPPGTVQPECTSQHPGGSTEPNDDDPQLRWFESATDGLLWLDALTQQLLSHPEVRQRVLLNVLVTPQGRACVPQPTAGPGTPTTSHPVLGSMAVQQVQPLLPPGVMLDPGLMVVTPRDMFGAMQRAMGGLGMGLGALDDAAGAVAAVPRPQQSWNYKGLRKLEIAHDAPAVYLRRLPGVVRRDRADKFTLQEAAARGGMGTILIDCMMPEVAYKLGRAPKYGA